MKRKESSTALTIFNLYKPKQIFEKSLLMLLVIFSCMYFGLFHRYNVLTACIDIWRDKIQLITYGSTTALGNLEIDLNKKYGFRVIHLGGVISTSEQKSTEMYNDVMLQHLENLWGPSWRKKYEAELKGLHGK